MSSTAYQMQRDRKYPFLVTIDLVLHWLLCLGILACASALVGVVVMNTSPQMLQEVAQFLQKIRGW